MKYVDNGQTMAVKSDMFHLCVWVHVQIEWFSVYISFMRIRKIVKLWYTYMTNRETVVAARQCTEFALLLLIECIFIFFVEFVCRLWNAIEWLQIKIKQTKDWNWYTKCDLKSTSPGESKREKKMTLNSKMDTSKQARKKNYTHQMHMDKLRWKSASWS